jgi:3-phenylpropionate/trans-cinnamate dioxygenase ferredoxin reductase subunit
MSEKNYKYIIVGGGLAGASAAVEIRANDKNGSILLIGSEQEYPYHRPPLSKKLWFGQKKIEEIFVQSNESYKQSNIDVLLGTTIVLLDAGQKKLSDDKGNAYSYNKLLLATGGIPRKLPNDIEGICYYRYISDYKKIRALAKEGRSAVIIGGGFIGSEIAAALNINKVNVTMVFPTHYICDRVLPNYLGLAIQNHFIEKGIKVLSGQKPVSFSKKGKKFVTTTDKGLKIESDILIAGIGIVPETGLAKQAGLTIDNGIVVNSFLQTSNPDIYAAGDNADFPYQVLGKRTRVEHWDNALNQGRCAARNMAGIEESFTYMPYFFSDLFEFGYEAVGEVDSQLETYADWEKENEKGVIYYLKDHKLRGVMLCNVWDKVETARELIRSGKSVNSVTLAGAVK